ncbi:MAG: amidase domain-containing protein [Clostridia bacterium]|nr:amidase domain-containing protein [Clostridia bacterium]
MYNRNKVYEYAQKWAYSRNPKYYNYDLVGGDCTNFASQCIYAGCGQMNYNRINGWYYINGNNKSPSWTGVEFLYNFLIANNGGGPKGRKSEINNLDVGDIIQLSFNGLTYSHTLVVVKQGRTIEDTLIAAHTFDTFGKRVSEYSFDLYRCVHIV